MTEVFAAALPRKAGCSWFDQENALPGTPDASTGPAPSMASRGGTPPPGVPGGADALRQEIDLAAETTQRFS